MGWPRILRIFKKGELDLTKYDYLCFKVKVDSNRSEVEDDITPFIVNFASHVKGVRYDSLIDFGDKPRIWLPQQLSIADMISKSGFSKREWRNLRKIQLVIAEKNYSDGTKMQFDIQDLALLKFNRPILKKIICDDVIMRSSKKTAVQVEGYGFSDGAKRKNSLLLTVSDNKGKKVSVMTMPLTAKPIVMLDTSNFEYGNYTLTLTVLSENGRKLSTTSKKITIINGLE